jgi:hypothetical protein
MWESAGVLAVNRRPKTCTNRIERRLREYQTAPNRKSLSATKPASNISFEHPFASKPRNQMMRLLYQAWSI